MSNIYIKDLLVKQPAIQLFAESLPRLLSGQVNLVEA
jgi:hypothetical protein